MHRIASGEIEAVATIEDFASLGVDLAVCEDKRSVPIGTEIEEELRVRVVA